MNNKVKGVNSQKNVLYYLAKCIIQIKNSIKNIKKINLN